MPCAVFPSMAAQLQPVNAQVPGDPHAPGLVVDDGNANEGCAGSAMCVIRSRRTGRCAPLAAVACIFGPTYLGRGSLAAAWRLHGARRRWGHAGSSSSVRRRARLPRMPPAAACECCGCVAALSWPLHAGTCRRMSLHAAGLQVTTCGWAAGRCASGRQRARCCTTGTQRDSLLHLVCWSSWC